MKKTFTFCFVFAALATTVFSEGASLVAVRADKLAHAPGEEIVFSVFALDSNKNPVEGNVSWKLEADDKRTAETGSGTATADSPVLVKTTMDKPGFLRLTATMKTAEGKEVKFIGGAAVSPDALQALPEPEDFDAFWAAQKKIVDDADLSKAVLTDAPENIASQDRYKNFRVRKLIFPYAEGMAPATAWVVTPKNAAPKSLKAIKASFDGYGFGGKQPPQWFDWNAINIQINAHGYDLAREPEYYKEFEEGTKSNGQGYGMDPAQNSNRDTCYFRGMVLRDLAALRVAMSLPEWSGEILEVGGGSQGGFQCVAMAALIPETTKCVPNAPWLCDQGGEAELGRLPGWRPKYVPALRYFDTVNFAKRVTCDVRITRSGLADYTCPPSGVTILYNNLTKAKSRFIHYIQGSEHLSNDWGEPNRNDWRQTFSK